MKIEKTFSVPIWNKEMEQRTINFWTRRGIAFKKISESNYIGKRGNLFGNLTSFDMSKLMTELTITISQNKIDCSLEVNTFAQQITEQNKAYWDLELDTFNNFLKRSDEKKEEWDKMGIEVKKAKMSTLSKGIISGLVGGVIGAGFLGKRYIPMIIIGAFIVFISGKIIAYLLKKQP